MLYRMRQIFKSMKSRAFVSLSILLSFSVLLITSLLMFINRHTELVSMLHTIIGFTLFVIIFWHLKNNFTPLKKYIHLPIREGKGKYNFSMPLAVLLALSVVCLSLMQFPPFKVFYHWGDILRARDKTEETLQFTYARIDNTQPQARGEKLTIDLRKGPYFMWPQYAIWLETQDGQLIQPLFVTQKLAKNNFSNKATKIDKNQIFTSNPMASESREKPTFTFEYDPDSASQRMRPEALPVFLHKLIAQTSGGALNVVDNDAPPKSSGVDAYAGATILDNFLLSTRSFKPLPDVYKICFEINQSFDFNDFYSSDRFPEDLVYSGNGYSGQPSVIYEAIIDRQLNEQYYAMKLVGHGHHSGQDGEIHYDMENLTTATQLIDRIIVEIKKP